MSQEKAERFMDAVEMDAALRERVAALTGADAIEKLCAIAHEQGFQFTPEDYRAAVVARSAGELSEESLDELIREMADGQGL